MRPEQVKEWISLFETNTSMIFFMGYRFKPPKTLVRSMDEIEEYIPILREDKNG